MTLSYRQRIFLAGLDRREIAQRMGLTYSALNNRLSGFTAWGREERVLQELLAEGEKCKGINLQQKERAEWTLV